LKWAATRRTARRGECRVPLGDMEEVPIADGEVDLVFFSQSLHHALHPERALEEAARIFSRRADCGSGPGKASL